MVSDARREAGIKSHQQRRVAEQEDGFRDEEGTLREKLNKAHADAVAAVHKRAQMPLTHGQTPAAAPSHESHVANRVKEISKLHNRQETKRKETDERHRKEFAEEMKKPAPAGKVERVRPERGDPLAPYWDRMSHPQRQKWHQIVAKYDHRRDDADGKQEANRVKHSRYDHTSVTSNAHGQNVAEHMRINDAEHAELRSLRAEVEIEANRQQRDRDQRGAA